MKPKQIAKMDAIPDGTQVTVEIRIGRCPVPLAIYHGKLRQRNKAGEWLVSAEQAAAPCAYVLLNETHRAKVRNGNHITVKV